MSGSNVESQLRGLLESVINMIIAILRDVVVQVLLTSVHRLLLLLFLNMHGSQSDLPLKGGVHWLGQTELQLLNEPVGAPFDDRALDQGRQELRGQCPDVLLLQVVNAEDHQSLPDIGPICDDGSLEEMPFLCQVGFG